MRSRRFPRRRLCSRRIGRVEHVLLLGGMSSWELIVTNNLINGTVNERKIKDCLACIFKITFENCY